MNDEVVLNEENVETPVVEDDEDDEEDMEDEEDDADEDMEDDA
jgi:hypothetical protein